MTQNYQFTPRRVGGAPSGAEFAIAANIVNVADGLSEASARALCDLLNATILAFDAQEKFDPHIDGPEGKVLSRRSAGTIEILPPAAAPRAVRVKYRGWQDGCGVRESFPLFNTLEESPFGPFDSTITRESAEKAGLPLVVVYEPNLTKAERRGITHASRCPDCGGDDFLIGPQGFLSLNILCLRCRTEFCVGPASGQRLEVPCSLARQRECYGLELPEPTAAHQLAGGGE